MATTIPGGKYLTADGTQYVDADGRVIASSEKSKLPAAEGKQNEETPRGPKAK